MKHTITLNTGNFSIVLTGEPTTAYVDKATKNGMVYDLQRGAASKVYTELAGVPTKSGKLKLPKGFERDSVSYSEESATDMKDTALEFFKDKLSDLSVVVLPYEKDSAESRVTAKAIYAKWQAAGKLKVKLGLLEADLDADSDFETIIEAIHSELVNPDKD